MEKKLVARLAVSAATYWIDRPYDYLVSPCHHELIEPGMRVSVPFGRGNRRCEAVVLSLSPESSLPKLKTIETVLDSRPILSPQQIKLCLWMRERFFCTVYEAVKAMLPAGLWYSLGTEYSVAGGVTADQALLSCGRSKAERAVLELILGSGGPVSSVRIQKELEGINYRDALSSLVEKGILERTGTSSRRVGDKAVRTARLAVPVEEARATIRTKRRAPAQAAVLDFLCQAGEAAASEILELTGAGLPVLKRLQEAGHIVLDSREEFRRPEYRRGNKEELPVLSDEQKYAFDGISGLMAEDEARAALLFGVTGSGKTSVYIHLIRRALDEGKTAILLVPEIALTPQMLRVFSSHFGDEIGVLHSSLSMGERYDEWKRIKSGTARLTIGTRSAIFAPCEDLGLIIIDEEHEDSYKSENSPRYHARDVAKYRCASSKALLVLGSATPDVVSRYSAESGRYSYFELTERYNLMDMPPVMVADMKNELRAGNGGSISSVLRQELETNISRGKQSILFLNRRGANKLITCVDCGHTFGCPHCSVSLTYHSVSGRLMCHYCGFSQRAGEQCPECGGSLSFVGIGTQGVEQELHELFPGVEILRMDADTVSKAGSHEALLEKFSSRGIPIMVGTQMVTKGLDFENVTLVGVLSADQALYAGDYRSGERTFSLITQVVGRSGRGRNPGRAVIQTFSPQNQVIMQAASQDYDAFYRAELDLRRVQQSPPFTELFAITASGLDEGLVYSCCQEMKSFLLGALTGKREARVLGPAPLFVVRVKRRYRYRVNIACEGDRLIRGVISDLLIRFNTDKRFRGVSVFADQGPSD